MVKNNEVKKFLSPLSVRRLLWVGKKTETKLNQMGIKTIGDLAEVDLPKLVKRFGTMGKRYYQFAQGIDFTKVGDREKIKSIGRETTFETNIGDYNLVIEALDRLAQNVQKKVSKHKLSFKTITIKIRFENFETHTHGKTLTSFTDNLQNLQKIAKKLIQRYFQKNRKIRLVGIRVSTLVSRNGQQTLV